ncbi:unnamed protein product [Brassicogethes aeneus]|uniref:C2H2-type domain-containing protein n=1 Tax=Brassicogethes aeneus TaxID=1431903 RepID=A0A9P0AS31_BRAAE|nr:unnamed protein product [Brassicogethes aeneus]
MQKKGAGLTSRPETAWNRVRWDDSESAFESRIRTSVISNLKHKDPSSVLEDCKALFRRRIINALKKDFAVKKKEACINIKNNDEACFAWAVTSALYPAAKNSDRTAAYPHYTSVLKLRGIQWPMTMKQIPSFEKQNGLSINVYILEKEKSKFTVLPTYLTKNNKDRHVNLLLIQDSYDEDAPTKHHFLWIKNMSRLLSSQLSKEYGQKYFCDRCLHYFRSQDKLAKHIENCVKINETAIKMPEPGKNILKFKNFRNKEKAPFIVYANLKSVLEPTDNPKKPQHHVPAAIEYYMKCS